MTLSLTGLTHVRHVAGTGSYAAAAREMGLSQTAVSQQIRQIETNYGVVLFRRQNGQLRPTPLCDELCDAAERVLLEQQSIERLLLRHSSLDSGRLSVGLGNAMPGIAVIAQFHRQFPSVSLFVETGSHEKITRQILMHELDAGILPDTPDDSRFRRVELMRNEVVAIVALDHPLARHNSVSISDIKREQLIFRSRGSSTQRVIDRVFLKSGFQPTPFLTLDTRDGVYEAVVHGMGVGFVWRTGTGRTEGVRILTIRGLANKHVETAFALAENKSDIVNAFFVSAGFWGQQKEWAGPG